MVCRKLLILLLCCFLAGEALAADRCKDNFSRLDVVGTGTLEVEPDQATLSFLMEKQDKTADAVRIAVDKNISTFLERLKQLGVAKEQIRADSIRITAVYRHDSNGNSSLQGYKGTRQVQIKTENFASIGVITEAAMQSGINGINGYSYGLKDEKKYRVKAQEEAIEDAKEQAARLSGGFGFKLGGICSVHFNDVQTVGLRAPQVMFANTMMRAAAKSDGNVSEQAYSQDKLTVKAEVSVTYCLDAENQP